MYFSLLSGKDTLYSIFFDSPENIVSSTILSLLIYTRTTGANNSISRANLSGSLTLLYVLFFFSSKQENKTVHFLSLRNDLILSPNVINILLSVYFVCVCISKIIVKLYHYIRTKRTQNRALFVCFLFKFSYFSKSSSFRSIISSIRSIANFPCFSYSTPSYSK
jgi:hypothetical protein